MATRPKVHGLPHGTTVMDKNGDVLFELGSGDLTAHLLVSSKVLSLASSVFSAMFTHGFSEGEGLSSNSPRVVPLPDDDPPAMTLLCNILHFCTGLIPMERDVAALAELAILSDKYDCAGALKPWSLLWIKEWLPCAGEEGFEKLLYVTYGLDLPEAFSHVTKALVENYPGLMKFDDACSGYEILPGGLTDDIKDERAKIRASIARAFDASISPVVLLANNPCMGEFLGHYYFKLSNIGLWPLSEKLMEMPLSEINSKISDIALPNLQTCRAYSYNCACYGAQAQLNNAKCGDVKTTLRQKILEVVDSTTGLCLDCVRTGGKSVENVECRVPHKLSS